VGYSSLDKLSHKGGDGIMSKTLAKTASQPRISTKLHWHLNRQATQMLPSGEQTCGDVVE
jgi:hypothetical protein